MIGPTLIALRGLEPSDRHLLAHYCFLEAGSGRRDREACRTLQALSEACESLDGRLASNRGVDLTYLRRRLADVPAERILVIAQATSRWLETASVDHLLELVAVLRETWRLFGNGNGGEGPPRSGGSD